LRRGASKARAKGLQPRSFKVFSCDAYGPGPDL